MKYELAPLSFYHHHEQMSKKGVSEMSEEVWAELYDQRKTQREHTRRLGEVEQTVYDLSISVATNGQELALNYAAFIELVRLVDRQQERIGRLEQIIVAMSNGLITTYPEAGTIHTHQIYPANGVRALVQEIKDSLAPSPAPLFDEVSTPANQASKEAGESRLVGEEPEPNGARRRGRMSELPVCVCVRCHTWITDRSAEPGFDNLCLECESDLTEEQEVLASQTIEDMEYEAEMALHDGQLCDY